MDNYVELYDNSMFKLLGKFNEFVEGYSSFYFHAEKKSRSLYEFSCQYAGTCGFCIPDNYLKQYCKQLKKMYETLQGECLIEDYDSGNELKLYFEGRQLKIDGKFSFGFESLEFRGEADQTILPRLISLLQSNGK